MHNREPQKENLPHVRAALAMCENIDWNVGRLLRHLEDLELTEDTILVYFCDNGPNGVRWNGGMKGRKGSTDEGGVRSPLHICWPGQIRGGTQVTQIGAAIDLLPTLAELTGIDVISQKPLDGISLAPLLVPSVADETLSPDSLRHWNRLIFSHWRGRVSVRTQQFRLDSQGKLYDLSVDPGQDEDVAQEHPQLTARLQTAVDDWKREVLAGHDQDDRPFLIGHPEYPFTQIPARDGKEHGNIKRSNRFPNCSFFTNWTSTDDMITWDAEVLADGEHDVEVYYTCPQTDIGATIELSFRDARVRGKITEGHDPPLQGGEHDRVPRQESYVKDFKPLRLGTIQLQKGKGTLTLRALDVPGSQVMDFRLIMLTRVFPNASRRPRPDKSRQIPRRSREADPSAARIAPRGYPE
jgi:hypothetical protein